MLENQEVAEDDAFLQEQLISVLRPKANKRFLGGYPGLYFYYKTQKEKPGFFNRFMYKKIGEDPVYRSDVKMEEVEELIHNRLENRGYFYSRVSNEVTLNEKRKESTATYTARLKAPYFMVGLKTDSMPEPLLSAIKGVMAESILKPGQRFDLARMKAERERIDAALKAKGYYNFNAGFLIFEADTNQYDDHRFDLFLGLKKDVPLKSIIPYRIDEVVVYPRIDLGTDSIAQDTVTIDGVHYIGGASFFRPDRLNEFITLRPGQRYDAKESKFTSRRLSTIGVYRFVNIQYHPIDGDTIGSLGRLRASIELSPLNKRAFRAEVQAVSKSNNFAGPAVTTTFTNRNLFKGGEILNLTTNLGYEFQLGGLENAAYNLTVGIGADLIFPRVLLPFKIKNDFFKYDVPKTKIGLSLDHSDRGGLYKLISATATFGYDWNAARFVTHQIDFISVNYNNLYQSSNIFEGILDDNPFLRQSFDQQFIAGLTYSFTYNELIDTKLKNAIYFNSAFDTAGNLIGLLSGSSTSDSSISILGLDFAQYVKLDLDFRLHHRMRNEQTIAFRLFGGYGLPFGNSAVMPFIKQYYSGGPYSVRAFGIRSIGPGSYDGGDSNDSGFFEQTGNIKLEANLEYRFPVFSYLKGAVFADAGNVWLSDENPDLPGGKIGSDFINQLGMGAGVGLRLDIQGFVIRFDFAAPFHSPIAAESEIYELQLDQTQINFAIGYPF